MVSNTSFYQGLETETLICASCGYCKVECPSYNNLGWESVSPRAKMKLARQVFNGSEMSEQHVKRVFQCTLCGKCREVCSTRIDTLKIWAEVRKKVAEKGKNPENMKILSNTIREAGNITGEEQVNREMWLAALDESFKEKTAKEAPVLYYTGCSSSLYPMVSKIPQSFVQILATAGVEFSLLGAEEECCGFPLIGTGELSKSTEIVGKNVEKIVARGAQVLVTTCSSCYHTFKYTYPEILRKKLPFEIMHSCQFIWNLIRDKKLDLQGNSERVTYHDPCDLGRNSGVYDPPREVLKSIPEIDFVELKKSRESSNCCGGGGNLEALDPNLVTKIALSRLQEIEKTGAKTVVSNCQQCKRTLQSAARKNKIRVKVMDLTEFVLRNLKK